MSEPINPPVEPPFNLLEAIKAQPHPMNGDWDKVRNKKKQYAKILFENFSHNTQLVMLMTEDIELRRIIVPAGYVNEFDTIVFRAIQNWNAANAVNPVQGSLAEVYKEVVSGHQEEF